MTKKKTFGENLKKYFYSGVGLASHTGEIVKHSVDEFVKEGRVSEEDGKRIVNNAIKKFEARKPELEAKYKEAVDKVVAFANKEVDILKKKITELQRKRNAKKAKKATPKRAKPVAKKSPKKKAAAKRTPAKAA